MKYLIRRDGMFFYAVTVSGDVYTHETKQAWRFDKGTVEQLLKNERRFAGCEMVRVNGDTVL